MYRYLYKVYLQHSHTADNTLLLFNTTLLRKADYLFVKKTENWVFIGLEIRLTAIHTSSEMSPLRRGFRIHAVTSIRYRNLIYSITCNFIYVLLHPWEMGTLRTGPTIHAEVVISLVFFILVTVTVCLIVFCTRRKWVHYARLYTNPYKSSIIVGRCLDPKQMQIWTRSSVYYACELGTRQE